MRKRMEVLRSENRTYRDWQAHCCGSKRRAVAGSSSLHAAAANEGRRKKTVVVRSPRAFLWFGRHLLQQQRSGTRRSYRHSSHHHRLPRILRAFLEIGHKGKPAQSHPLPSLTTSCRLKTSHAASKHPRDDAHSQVPSPVGLPDSRASREAGLATSAATPPASFNTSRQRRNPSPRIRTPS